MMATRSLLQDHLDPPPPKEPQIGVAHAIFAWFGGSLLAHLRKCELAVQQSRSMRGMLLFATVCVSAMLAGVAWTLASHSLATGVAVGVVWFLVCTMLDRNLMASMDGTGSTSKDRSKVAMLILMRVGIIVVMAHLNSHFVQLWMFNTEIEQVLVAKRNENLARVTGDLKQATSSYRTWYDAERKRIDDSLAETRKARQALVDEISGKGGSGRPGYAQIAKAKEETIRREEANLSKEEATFQEMAKDGVEANAKRQAEASHKELTDQIKTQRADGLVDRSKALEKVAGENPLVWWMYGLFMLIECLAFLVKMFSRSDEYDLRIDRMKAEAEDRFGEEDLHERARIRLLVMDDSRLEVSQRGELVEISSDHAIFTANLFKHHASEVDSMAEYASRVDAAQARMKAAGLPARIRDPIVDQAHGRVVNFRNIRA